MEKMDAATDEPDTEVLNAIRSMRKDFTEKFEDVLAGIGGLKNELQAQANRITETEDRIGRAEDDLHAMHNTVKKLKEKCDTLESRVEEQENRGRRNNLRIIGIPEKAEGQDMCAFLEGWLPKALGTDIFPSPPVIERAHRIGRLIPGQDSKPRAVIMRLLNYREKEKVMRAARRRGDVKFENHIVRFYPDYSAETHRQQRLFDAVKRQLQSMGLRYGMFYPAILVVTYNGQQHSFTSAPDAEKFVQSIKRDTASTSAPDDE